MTDFDFERLCKDLFEEVLGVRLEIFSAGAGGGIDLRHIARSGTTVIQCKHWMKSGRGKLISHMINTELPKVKKLKPVRYILASTVDMTVDAKNKLYSELRPFVESPNDILGIDEIVSLIDRYPVIARRHIRLWLNDSNVLDAAISKNVLWRSSHFADEISETLQTYVPSSSLTQASKILDARHICIISGAPGVGKTSLAHALCAIYVMAGYEVIEISENVEDAYRMWDDTSKQIFIYDDFLGQSALEDKLYKNEDRRLLALMSRISQERNKRFICTTRGYILAQAKHRYERLDRENFNPITCTVNLDDYSREIRAGILYNHTYWSDWPAAAKSDLAEPSNYRKIIDHRNFNPRVITNAFGSPLPSAASGDPASYLVENLDDPTRLWRHIFENQLTRMDRALLVALFSLGGECAVGELRQLLLSRSDWEGPQFRRSLEILEGTFLKISVDDSDSYIRFNNPSVNDFLVRAVADDVRLLREVLQNVHSFEQIANIWQYSSSARDDIANRIDLECLAGDLEEAALVIVGDPNATGRDLVSRLVIALQMSSTLGLSRIDAYVADLLCQQGSIYRGRFEDIVEIIKEASKSTNPRVRSHFKWIMQEGLAALFNRDRSGCGIFRAAIHGNELAEFVEPKILEDLNRQAISEVDRLMELYEFGSLDEELDRDAFAYSLQYIQIYEDMYQVWPMADTAMSEFNIQPPPDDKVVFDDFEEEDPDFTDGLVYRIMKSLEEVSLKY